MKSVDEAKGAVIVEWMETKRMDSNMTKITANTKEASVKASLSLIYMAHHVNINN